MVKLKNKNIPLYLQLKQLLISSIEGGVWPTGSQLPPERELAEKMEVSRKTVSQAYKELEREGMLYSYPGRGTFVAGKQLNQPQHQNQLIEAIDVCVIKAIEVGISPKEFLSLCLKRMEDRLKKMNNF